MQNQIIRKYDIIIFGAKGDLSFRKLIPALYQLEKKELLHIHTRIIGVGRSNWSITDYVTETLQKMKQFQNESIISKVWNNFKNKLLFCNVDVSHMKQFIQLQMILSQTCNDKIYYFATPPNTFGDICKGLGYIKYNNHPNKIIVEKPIGQSLYTSKKIHKQLSKYFSEDRIFRIDHYLGKETILNLLVLRFSNILFYNNWDNKTIECIEINVAEKIGIEGRWGYFNKIGQTRDMVQNHLLQILSLIAMSPPTNLNSTSIKKEKIKVLKSLRIINSETIRQKTIRGQYSKGMIDNNPVSSYLNEPGADKNSTTETFVAIEANIDNKRWENVPFYLRTGKRLAEKKSEIVIYFKKVPGCLFQKNKNIKHNNTLKITLQPDEGIKINFFNKAPDIHYKYLLQKTALTFKYQDILKNKKISDAYELLLLESMNNDQSLFVSKEEIEISWKWIDAIIQTWEENKIYPILYPAGECHLDFPNKKIY